MHYNTTILFASTYNCSSYGAGSYSSSTECATGTSTSSSGAGGLANTGQSILLPLTAGVLLIAVAIAVLVHTLRRRKK